MNSIVIVFATFVFIVIIRVIPIPSVMTLGALRITMIPRPVASMTSLTIRLTIMGEFCPIPTVGTVALGALSPKMVGWSILRMTGFTVQLSVVVETGATPGLGGMAA